MLDDDAPEMSEFPEVAGIPLSFPKVPPVGYTLVLPPGWDHIPLRQGTDAAVKRILDASFAGFGRDQVAQYRHDVEQRLQKVIDKARAQAGLDLYLPVELMHGMTIAASIVVSEGAFETKEEIDPEYLVATLASLHENGNVVEVDGTLAVRVERISPPEDPTSGEAGAGLGSRRVDYTVAVPHEARRIIIIAFSTLGAGDPDDDFAKLLVELFDAVMTTFRWKPAPVA